MTRSAPLVPGVRTKTEVRAMLDVRDRYLAPCLLGPFADDMARRLSRISMGPLLETLADTGVLTQAMASAMSAGLSILATDPSAEMIAHASVKPGMARVSWQQADPAALPFADATFGIVACHFGIAALAERVRAFSEARRVMKPRGRFVFSVPAHLRQNPVAGCVQDALEALFPVDGPEYLARVLHGYSDNEAIDNDLTDAGYTDAIYSSVELAFVASSARDVAIGYCLGTPLRGEFGDRDSDAVVAAVEAALVRRFGSGVVEATMRAHVISASG